MSVLNILNMLYSLHFFSSKCRLFHNATLFGFCITHILNTGVLKFEKKIRRQKVKDPLHSGDRNKSIGLWTWLYTRFQIRCLINFIFPVACQPVQSAIL